MGLEFVHFSCICLFLSSFFFFFAFLSLFLSSAFFFIEVYDDFFFLLPFPPGFLRKAFPADIYPLFIQSINSEIVARRPISFLIRRYTLFTYALRNPHARELNGFPSENLLLFYCVYIYYETVQSWLNSATRLPLIFGASGQANEYPAT